MRVRRDRYSYFLELSPRARAHDRCLWSLPKGVCAFILLVIANWQRLFVSQGHTRHLATGHQIFRSRSALFTLNFLARTPTTMPKRRRDENEEAESSPLADDALEAKILELVRKRGLTKTC